MKTVVVYYSMSGNVAYAAEKVAKETPADVVEIAPVHAYPSTGVKKFLWGGKAVMMGDAPGDLAAAHATGALFFPINPGYEADSWDRFYSEGYKKFLEGTYAGEYEQKLIREFEALLPEGQEEIP